MGVRWWRDTRWLDRAQERAADFAVDGLQVQWFTNGNGEGWSLHPCVKLASGGSTGTYSALEGDRPPAASASAVARMIEVSVIVPMMQAEILPRLSVGATREDMLRHLHPEWT